MLGFCMHIYIVRRCHGYTGSMFCSWRSIFIRRKVMIDLGIVLIHLGYVIENAPLHSAGMNVEKEDAFVY